VKFLIGLSSTSFWQRRHLLPGHDNFTGYATVKDKCKYVFLHTSAARLQIEVRREALPCSAIRKLFGQYTYTLFILIKYNCLSDSRWSVFIPVLFCYLLFLCVKLKPGIFSHFCVQNWIASYRILTNLFRGQVWNKKRSCRWDITNRRPSYLQIQTEVCFWCLSTFQPNVVFCGPQLGLHDTYYSKSVWRSV